MDPWSEVWRGQEHDGGRGSTSSGAATQVHSQVVRAQPRLVCPNEHRLSCLVEALHRSAIDLRRFALAHLHKHNQTPASDHTRIHLAQYYYIASQLGREQGCDRETPRARLGRVGASCVLAGREDDAGGGTKKAVAKKHRQYGGGTLPRSLCACDIARQRILTSLRSTLGAF